VKSNIFLSEGEEKTDIIDAISAILLQGICTI
jgi:hypothetical protein